jgi:hypothetical protein
VLPVKAAASNSYPPVRGIAMRDCALATALVGLFIASAAHAQTLDQQERCAMEAKRSFQEIEAKDLAQGKAVGVSQIESNYQSHYNTKMGKCLMLVEKSSMLGAGNSSTTAHLIDANEQRPYATYVWISRKDKKYWDVPPAACELDPSMREKRTCKTREEFDAFVAGYLEE